MPAHIHRVRQREQELALTPVASAIRCRRWQVQALESGLVKGGHSFAPHTDTADIALSEGSYASLMVFPTQPMSSGDNRG